jgi:glutathione synthase/RimK-type ligase-like ATP-grasp enzyme
VSSVTSLYLRPYETERMPAVRAAGLGGPVWARAVQVDDTLLSWADLTPAVVVNRPSAMASNGSKPYQGAWVERFGFHYPETLMTTDADLVREFRAAHAAVIYKSISGVRSKVTRLTEVNVDRLDDVAWCPTQFQEYVPGDDYRVHIVGDQVFACRIASTAEDYRYANATTDALKISASAIPADVEKRAIELTRDMGLLVSGIDLRERPDGRWYCFEVNPSPGFSYFEAATDQPIAEAVADLLRADT